MNYKHIAIIALVLMLALAVPASAVWSNGNWITDDKKDEYFGNAEVKYDPTTGVTSKYKSPEDTNLMTYQGMVKGILQSGGVAAGGERFYFHRIGSPENATLVQYFHPDGLYTGYLVPGEYEVILPQGTGSACGVYSDDWGYVGNPHEERTKITVVAGKVSSPFVFIGNSYSALSSVCARIVSIVSAQYCDGNDANCVDVKADVETTVSSGFESFVFVNNQILEVDGITLITGTTAPASAVTPFNVTIVYNTGCGSGNKIVYGNETDIISLN